MENFRRGETITFVLERPEGGWTGLTSSKLILFQRLNDPSSIVEIPYSQWTPADENNTPYDGDKTATLSSTTTSGMKLGAWNVEVAMVTTGDVVGISYEQAEFNLHESAYNVLDHATPQQ